MLRTAACERNRPTTHTITAFRMRRRRAGLDRRSFDLFLGAGRPILFLAGLCGLATVLFVPVGLGLALPFFAAGLGAVVLFCWMGERFAGNFAPGITSEFGGVSEVAPALRQAPIDPPTTGTGRRRRMATMIASASQLLDIGNLAYSRLSRRQDRALEQRLLADLFRETAVLVGGQFVGTALGILARALQVDHVIVCEILDHNRVRVRHCCSGTHDVAGFEYDIAGSPCERVIGQEPRCYPVGVQRLFPGHPLMRKLAVEGYLGVPLCGRDGRPAGLLAVLHDTPLRAPGLGMSVCVALAKRIGAELERMRTEQDLRQTERHLCEVAFNDQLTGLPNRMLLMNRFGHAVDRACCRRHNLAVLFLDIDGFKQVNDSAGHDIGDQVLAEAARRIAGCVRSADTVARLGGDEFVILLERCRDERAVRTVAEHTLSVFSRPYCADGRCWSLSASIGIGVYDGGSPDIQALYLLKQADMAMYAVKEGEPGHYRFASSCRFGNILTENGFGVRFRKGVE